jgi:hypothetical protein
MSWRIAYWRGSTRLRSSIVEDATQDGVASLLRSLAAKQLDHKYLRASETDPPECPEIRSNRNGTRVWTTGRDFHYTAEWFSGDDNHKRKRDR